MKVQVCTCWLSSKCIDKIERLRERILQILKWDLGFTNESAAGLVVEECVVANRDTHGALCHITITGASVLPHRPRSKFETAYRAIRQLYQDAIMRHPGDLMPVSLSLIIHLDRELEGSSFVEEAEINVT